jgi:hypothetical protein
MRARTFYIMWRVIYWAIVAPIFALILFIIYVLWFNQDLMVNVFSKIF